MKQLFEKILQGYRIFRKKYAIGDNSIMHQLANHGQKPEIMVIACCDSRVDPALILQCNPGELFIVRNVANIIPPYEADERHHGTSAALEFGVRYLNVKHLIILGHTQCGGIEAVRNSPKENDFITRWVSLINTDKLATIQNTDELAQQTLIQSYQNCSTFPWIKERIAQQKLAIHLWFFNIKEGKIANYSFKDQRYEDLI